MAKKYEDQQHTDKHRHKEGCYFGDKSSDGTEFEKNRFQEPGHFGQQIRTETSPNHNSHPMDDALAVLGPNTKGGPLDVSHSLTGAGEVKTYNEEGRKKRR